MSYDSKRIDEITRNGYKTTQVARVQPDRRRPIEHFAVSIGGTFEAFSRFNIVRSYEPFLRASVELRPLLNRVMSPRLSSVLLVALFAITTSRVFAEYSRKELATGKAITATVRAAESAYYEGKYEVAAKNIRKGMGQLHEALDSDNPDFVRALKTLAGRLDKVHFKTELQGTSLPPFRLDRPAAESETGPSMGKVSSSTSASTTVASTTTPKPAGSSTKTPPGSGTKTPPATPPTNSVPTTDGMLVSFTKTVAPILNNKCGRCHVSGNRGGFKASSFSALMKGPPEGVVIFAGDVVGSRLIETIETGDMPRGGGKVSPAELKSLKDWIKQGAKFDGPDPNAPLAAGANPVAGGNNPAPPMIKQATGNETVSFVSNVAPLLVENCTGCHLDAMQTRGGLRLDSFVQLMRGGDSGAMIVPGKGEQSLLVQKLRGTAADGERMPGGGRPPLPDESIQLISKWIDEGATVDGDSRRPIKVLSRLAWVSNASSEEVSQRRSELASKNMKLADSAAPISHSDTQHFHVIGATSSGTLELVGQIAERQMKMAKSIASQGRGAAGEDYFHGRSTIFVLPRRYAYSEFTKMVEQRSVPSDWSSHWHFDGEDAYVAMVATDSDDEDVLETRLMSPVISLAVATRGSDVPRWFAEGVGAAASMQQNAKSRTEKEKLRLLSVEAAARVKNANDFLKDKLTPEQSDSFGAGLAMGMLDRSQRKSFNACLRSLESGRSFNDAFQMGFGAPPAAYIDRFLQYVR